VTYFSNKLAKSQTLQTPKIETFTNFKYESFEMSCPIEELALSKNHSNLTKTFANLPKLNRIVSEL